MKTLYGLLLAGLAIAATKSTPVQPVAPETGSLSSSVTYYGERDIIKVRCSVRVGVTIVLPRGEQIKDVLWGDKENWPVSATGNVLFVKCGEEKSKTSMSVVTMAQNLYTFSMEEGLLPTLKIFVEPKGDEIMTHIENTKLVPVEALQAEQQSRLRAEEHAAQVEAEAAKKTETAKREAAEAVDKFKSTYPAKVMKVPYRFTKAKEPFNVADIWHDDKFTYIRHSAKEQPAIWEKLDGKPAIVGQEVIGDGVIRLDHIVSKGYLAIGKTKTEFWATE